jgi:hypothetical protein
LINTSQQIGGALGIAVLSSVAVSHSQSSEGASQALTNGFHAAFWVGAAVAAVGVIASVVLVRREDLAELPAGVPVAA